MTPGLLAAILCVLVASCSSPAPPAPPPAPAPGPAQLADWKLTIPEVGKSGSAAVVEPARVSPPWLTTDPSGNLVFWAPVAGATTKHSEHARTELDNLSDFTAGDDPEALTASVSVGQVPPVGQEVIIGQIHGADDISSVPYVMLFYSAGTVKVVVKQEHSGTALQDYPLLTDVPLGARFDYGIRDDGDGSLTFTAGYDGQTPSVTAPVPAAFRGATVRFQAGAYQLDSPESGTASPSDGARVTFYGLSTGPPPATS